MHAKALSTPSWSVEPDLLLVLMAGVLRGRRCQPLSQGLVVVQDSAGIQGLRHAGRPQRGVVELGGHYRDAGGVGRHFLGGLDVAVRAARVAVVLVRVWLTTENKTKIINLVVIGKHDRDSILNKNAQ